MNQITDKSKNDKNVKYAKIGVIAMVIVAIFCAGFSYNKGSGDTTSKTETLEKKLVEQEKTIKEQSKQIEELEQNKKKIEVAEDVTVVSTEMCKFIVPAKRFIIDDYTYVHTDEYTKKWDVWGCNLFWQKDVERITYTGKMGLGIDFDKISYEIDQDEDKDGNPKNSGRIVIHLPNPKIQSHVIVNNTFRADSVSDSWMVSSDAEEYEQFKIAMMREEENNVLNNQNVWDKTKVNTQNTIQSVLQLSNILGKYKIEFEWDGDKFNAPTQRRVDTNNHSVTGSAVDFKA